MERSEGRAATQEDFADVPSGVDATAPGESWTLDTYIDPATDLSQYHLMHWTQNGRTMRRFEYTTPGSDLRALAVVSRTNVWMVGEHWNDAGGKRLGPIVLHGTAGASRE